MSFTKVVGPGIHTLAQLRTHNIHSAGIITATKFVGEMESGGGSSTFQNVTVSGNLTVQGDTTTLNTTLRNVELLRVAADSDEPAGIITQTGAGDLLRLYDGTSQRVTVDDTGKVGIGITVPTKSLHVVTDLSDSIPLLVERTHTENVNIQYKNSTSSMFAGLAGDALGWGVDDDANIGVDPMFIVRRDSGSVGIGTSNPVFPSGSGIEIHSRQNPRIKLSNSATGLSATDGTQLYLSTDGETILDNKDGKNIRIDTGGSQKFIIASDGNILPGSNNSQSIGTGTTNFHSIWASTRFRGNDDVKLILGSSQDLVIRHDGSNNIIGSPVGGDLQIKSGTGDNDNQLISSFQHGTGSVGIGTTYSHGKLDISTASSVNGATQWYGQNFGIVIRHFTGSFPNNEGNGICFTQPYHTTDPNPVRTGAIIGYKQSGNGSFGGGLIFKAQQNGANSLIEAFRISQEGNVGINRVGPNQRLCVSGNIEVNAYDNRNGQDGYYLPKGLIIGNAFDAEKLVGVNSVTDDRNAIIWQERGLDLDFATSDTWRMKLTYDGKLGIGKTDPTNVLDVQGGSTNTAIVARSTDTKAQVSLVDNATTGVGCVAIGAEGDDLFLTSGSGGAEALRINTGGDVILGGHDAVIEPGGYASHLEIHGTATDAGISIIRYSANAGGPTLLFGKSNNNTIGSITKVDADDNLGRIEFYGVDTDWEPGASIRAFADGEWRSGSPGSEDNTDSPGRIEFHTTPNGSDNLQERLRIHSHGQLELKVPDANDALKITPSGTNAPAKINFNTPGTGSAIFKVQGEEKLRIESGGNVRISDEHLRFDTTGKGIIFGIDGGSNRPSIIGNYTSSSDNNMVLNVTGTERLRIGSTGVVHINSVAGGQAVVAFGDPEGDSFQDQNRIGGDTVVVANDAISDAISTPRKGCFVMVTSFKESNSTAGIYPQPSFSGMAYIDSGPSRLIYICNLGTNVGTDMSAKNSYDGTVTNSDDGKVTIMGGNTEGTFRIVNRANGPYRFQVTFL